MNLLPAPPSKTSETSETKVSAPPEAKKKKRWPWIVGAIVVVVAASNYAQKNDTTPTPLPNASVEVPSFSTPAPEPSEIEISPEMIVDLTIAENPGSLERFCHAYDVVGYDAGLRAFKTGYDNSNPSAEDVYQEAISRC